jgi:hypothetical protein
VIAAAGEFEVIDGTFHAEHDPVESFMVFKTPNDAKAEPTTVHVTGPRKIGDWSGNAKMILHGYS